MRVNREPTGLYFDDIALGQSAMSPLIEVSAEDIIAFARQWDPHPFHLDDDAARESMFGGHVASGLHTLSLTMRAHFDTGLFGGTAIAGAGIRELRWVKPVHAGDFLRVVATVRKLRTTTKTDRGLVALGIETFNQRDYLVMTCELDMLVARRSKG